MSTAPRPASGPVAISAAEEYALRQLKLHTGDEADYFYCTECNWVRTLSGVPREDASRETFRRETAVPAFEGHVCSEYPRSIQAASARISPPVSVAEEFREHLRQLSRPSAWAIGLGIAAGASLLAMVATAMLGARQFRVDVSGPAPLFFGALALLLLMAWLVQDRTRTSYVNFFRMMGEMLHRSQTQEELRRDTLTGTYNRAALHEFAEIYLSHANRSRQPLTLVVADLDHFGELNNRFGHMAGDSALADFAQLLMRATRGSDIVARYGGDEFVLLLTETPREGSDTVVDRVKREVAKRNEALTKGQVPVSFTAGSALLERGMAFPELFAKADVDLLRRKSQRAPAN